MQSLNFLTLIICLLNVDNEYCAPASGAAGDAHIQGAFPAGKTWSFHVQTTVLLNEKGEESKDVGFLVKGTLDLQSLWAKDGERLLQFQLNDLKLHIRSRKAPAPDGFVFHSSNLDGSPVTPFFAHWHQGRIPKILVAQDQIISITNLQKGIASLFQYQIGAGEVNETDSSGHCLIEYNTDGLVLTKRKVQCLSKDLPYLSNPELSLSTQVTSQRTITYELDASRKWFESVKVKEIHRMFPSVKEDVGNQVDVAEIVELTGTNVVNQLTGDSFDEVVQLVSGKLGKVFTQQSLLTEREISDNKIKSFVKVVEELRDKLKTNLLGSLPSAKVIPTLISTAKSSTREDIAKTLAAKKNKDILAQLYDILGFVQTAESHEAVMKKLHFDDKKLEDFSERYLWALSICSQPNPDIVKDLLNRLKKHPNISPKVKETLLLTVASMAHRLSKLPTLEDHKAQHLVEEHLLQGLDYAKNEEKTMYLRALKNFRSQTTIATLLDVVNNGTDKQQVLGWKAIRALGPSHWNPAVLQSASRTLFQLRKPHDSSARTLAADILLESNPDESTLKSLIYHLVSSCPSFEVKQYIFQRIKMIADTNEQFAQSVWRIIRADSKLNNYSVLGLKGYSTALARRFLTSAHTNGSLLTVQEMNGMTVKRGIVDIVLEKSGVQEEIFSLGIFTRGLNSFIASDGENPDGDDVATAGMELSVLGTQIRPFTFFQGHGELMGHVWSGTASEKTPAFQALALLQHHHEYLRLGPGFIAEMDVNGAASFDLSGKMEISLWNRNAASAVEKSAGIVLEGIIRVDTSFVKSQAEFSVSLEPKLHLQTDIDFYSTVNICMRLSQPPLVLKHNVYKIERIPGSKHRLRKVKYRLEEIPGKSYALNKKNNDMCNIILKDN